MPQVTGDRFSSSSMSDCVFCLPEGRRFRTQRQCRDCGKALCLVCRPEVPGVPFLCPDCGGGPREDAIHAPGATITRIQSAGHKVPYWLLVLQERLEIVTDVEKLEEEIVPE